MDTEYEARIVKKFFTKRIQDRVIYELSTPKKREDAIGRLNHNYKNTLNEKYLVKIPKPNSDYTEILNLLKNHGAGDLCYTMSFCEAIDGKHLPLAHALEKAVGYGFPSFISCIPNKLAYFEAEQIFGPPERFILLVRDGL
jgi:hypothetical protein